MKFTPFLLPKAATAALAALTLSACVSQQPLWRAQEGVDYRVDIVDRPAERRFELEFVSLADRPLCFATESWPFRGKIMTDGLEAGVLIDGERYAIRDWNMGLCVGGNECGSRVERGGRAHGYLSYDEFPSAPFDEARERSLQFRIGVFACYGGERRV